MSKVWFITGSSRGFGRRFAEAALSRGDRVVAAARDGDALAGLTAVHGESVLPLVLDVTDRAATTRAVDRAHEHFGRLDVVVNSAGAGHIGMVEEISEGDIRAQFETNVLGALWVTQAALPHLRAQGGGHVVNLSSMLGAAPFPSTGAYSAAKAALAALTESLAQEVAGFGIKATVVEPGPFGTDFAASATYAAPLEAYTEVRNAVDSAFAGMPVPDPAGVGAALLSVVDAVEPPRHVFFGSLPLQVVPPRFAERLDGYEQWAEVAARAGAGRS
jgi:NAD(P)-dependent dehydrogenase (short-subunit alcohol dehydrogenase family)